MWMLQSHSVLFQTNTTELMNNILDSDLPLFCLSNPVGIIIHCSLFCFTLIGVDDAQEKKQG
jgi:hypothetical protein